MKWFEVGDAIDGDYEIMEELGEGAYGAVFRVRHCLDDRIYALKLFRAAGSEKEIRRELKALLLVSHPNVVRFVWSGTTPDGDFYLVTELIEGVSLEEHPAWGSPLPIDKVAEWGRQLLNALIAIHPDHERLEQLRLKEELSAEEFDEIEQLRAEGLVHRDVKPANLLVRSTTDELVLVDFNIASRAGTQVQTRASTPSYEPPDADYTQWTVDTDLFAAGVVIFQLACGQHPYQGDNPRHPDGPIAADLVVPGLTAPVVAFLQKAVARHREERFPTATAMLGALLSAAAPADPSVDSRQPTPETSSGVTFGVASAADYREWQIEDLPGAGSSQHEVIDALVSLVGVEGPMVCERLYELYTRGSGDPGVGSVKAQLNRAVQAAVGSGRLRQIEPIGGGQIDKTVYLPGAPGIVVRPPGPRLFQHVPRTEVMVAAANAIASAGVESAVEHLIDWYGVADEPWNRAQLFQIVKRVADGISTANSNRSEQPGLSAGVLSEGDPRWDRHSGRDGHRGAEWGVGDEEQMAALIAASTPRLRHFLELLASSPGREFDTDELASELDVVGAAGVAGALSPFKFWRNEGRSLPFRWWKNDGATTYAMKPSVALVVRKALDEWRAGA